MFASYFSISETTDGRKQYTVQGLIIPPESLELEQVDQIQALNPTMIALINAIRDALKPMQIIEVDFQVTVDNSDDLRGSY